MIPELNFNGLLGQLTNANAAQTDAIKRRLGVKPKENHQLTAKSLFEERIGEIENVAIQQALRNGELTVVDHVIYSARAISTLTGVEMFKASDKESYDATDIITNVNSGRLGQEVFLCTHVAWLIGETPTSSAKVGNVDFTAACGASSTPQVIYNGILTMKSGQKILMDKFATSAFQHNRTEIGVKTIKLEVPKMFQANQDIRFDVKIPVGYTASASNSGFVKVLLYGVITAKA